MVEKPDCDICERTWALSEKTPDCSKCIPQPLDENKEALKVFNIVQGQHIMGMGGPVDLNLTALEFAMDLYKVPQGRRLDVYNRVMTAYRAMLKKIREASEK